MSGAMYVGRPRTLGGGCRSWRVRAYGGSRPRISVLDPERNYKRRFWYPDHAKGQTLLDLFNATEEYFDRIEALALVPTIGWAAHLWLDSLANSDLEADTIDNRRSLVKVWIMEFADPQGLVLGALPLEEWTPAVTQRFLDSVAQGVSADPGGCDVHRIGGHRLNDLRNVLSGIRRYVHANAMLSLENDPLAEVKTPDNAKLITEQGHDPKYVHPRVRPKTEAVEALLRAAEAEARERARAIDPLQLRIGCYIGPRLSEQLGIAVEDLDLGTRQIHIRGAWMSPRKSDPKSKSDPEKKRKVDPYWRPWTKNRCHRHIPFMGSWESELAVAITRALGLPEDTPWETLIRMVDDLRAAFDEWHDAYIATQGNEDARKALPPMPQRHFLFCDPKTGIPWEQEAFNARFRALRQATSTLAAQDPSIAAWPQHIPYRSARHHAATWMHANVDGAGGSDWVVVANIIGNDAETCRTHYALPGSGDADRAFASMAAM